MKSLFRIICFIVCAVAFSGCTKQSVTNTYPVTAENIIEENLIVPELEGEYELLYLTDMHIVLQTPEDSEEQVALGEERFPMFVNGAGVPSVEQFSGWITYAKEKEPDAVLFGGDMIDYPSSANLEVIQANLTKLQIPFLYTPGNHDWTYPWEYMTEKAKTEYLPLLEPMMQNNTVIQTLEIGELLIVAVDNSVGQVNAEALAEYEQILAKGKPTIVVVHVPFITQSVLTKAREVWSSPVVIGAGNYGGIYPDEASTKFMELTTAKESPVIAVLAGHVHFYDKDYIVGEKEVLQIVGDAGYKGKGMLLHITGGKEKD